MEKFFYPESVAVTGVSLNRVNLGHIILANMSQIGYTGRLYGIGREEGELREKKVYKDVESLPETPDIAIIITPAGTVPGLMRDFGKKGTKHVVIESGGFTEYSMENRSLEEEVLSIAREYGMRIIGPNCIGTINTENRLFMPFVMFSGELNKGPISIVSQSGGVGDSFMRIATENHIYFNKFAAVGNKLDVDEVDCLDYLIDDEGTGAVLMYLEGFSRGREFFNSVMRASKPVVVMKSNRSAMSAKIAQSHTAALSASDDVVDAALQQAGVIRVEGEDELTIAAKTLVLPEMKGNRVAVLSRSGGHAVITVDACARFGLDLIEFPDSFIEKIKGMYNTSIIAHQNPLDLGEIFDYTIFIQIVEETLKLDTVDGIIFNHLYLPSYEAEMSRTFLSSVSELVQKYNKPVAMTFISDAAELLDIQMNHPFPTFTSPMQSATALKIMRDYKRNILSRNNRGEPEKYNINTDIINEIKEKSVAENRILLTDEALEICNAAGIKPVRGVRISGPADTELKNFSYPAAVKLLSKEASHKSDIGGVKLNLGSAEEAADAIASMMDSIAGLDSPPSVDGFLLQEMKGGEEFFIGGRRDGVFGPVVMAGFGGIFIEIFRDRAIRVAPVTRSEALDMLKELQSYPVLEGARGRPRLDIEALIDIICRISVVLVSDEEIEEIDLNPVLVHPAGEGVSVVDSRIFLKKG